MMPNESSGAKRGDQESPAVAKFEPLTSGIDHYVQYYTKINRLVSLVVNGRVIEDILG